LHIANCSLTAIPSIVKSMEKLENLHLDFNDLSGDQDFSLIPPSMKFITMEFCKLQKLPKELRPLDNLVGLYVQRYALIEGMHCADSSDALAHQTARR
jgi:hypothetical protein